VDGLLGILPKQLGLSHNSLLIRGHHVAAFLEPADCLKVLTRCGFSNYPQPHLKLTRYPGLYFTARRWDVRMLPYAADNWIGSTIEGSSFSGLLIRVQIGQSASARPGTVASSHLGRGSSPSQRT
jgi:hypothetical protein